jgi:hypothetical protein
MFEQNLCDSANVIPPDPLRPPRRKVESERKTTKEPEKYRLERISLPVRIQWIKKLFLVRIRSIAKL